MIEQGKLEMGSKSADDFTAAMVRQRKKFDLRLEFSSITLSRQKHG